MFEVIGHSRLEFPELVGHHVVKQGYMEFEYGPLALAMKYGGLALINEIDLLEPSTAAGLNGILDGQPLCIPENDGELIMPHPMFRFAATANSNGGSDETGLYQGILRQNLALMDRFVLCEVTYPKPEAEEQLLEKTAPNCRMPSAKRWWNTPTKCCGCSWKNPGTAITAAALKSLLAPAHYSVGLI